MSNDQAAKVSADKLRKRGKNYTAARLKVNKDQSYSLSEAIGLLKEVSYTKFDPSVELHMMLGLDPKKPDQAIRGTVSLPHGTGKTVTVLAFVPEDKADVALSAGADFAGEEEYIEKVKNGWLEFDVVVATPDMMPKIAQLGRTLGTKGMMPSPKAGTVSANIAETIKALKSGRIEYRLEKAPIIHTIFGKLSFGEEKLLENLTMLVQTINRAKPNSAKGVYIKSASINPTMGPGIPLDLNELRALR